MRAAVRLLGCALLVACGVQVPNLDSPGQTVVCFGDSITAGVGAPPGSSYPDLLAQELGIPVINAGVPGETAADGLRRLDQVLALDPWLVVVELGGNDLLRQVPVERTEEALREIVERLLAARVVPVLVEVRGPFGRRYAEMFRRLEKEYRVPVVRDVLAEILSDPRLKSDTIHPNATGYARLAAGVAREVRPIVAARKQLRP